MLMSPRVVRPIPLLQDHDPHPHLRQAGEHADLDQQIAALRVQLAQKK